MTRKRTSGSGAAQPNRKVRPPGDTEKGTGDRVSGDDPMTGAQASRLKALSEEAFEYDAFDPALTKAEASRRINALTAKLAKLGEPPHTQ